VQRPATAPRTIAGKPCPSRRSTANATTPPGTPESSTRATSGRQPVTIATAPRSITTPTTTPSPTVNGTRKPSSSANSTNQE
jgi:hypothetical protein